MRHPYLILAFWFKSKVFWFYGKQIGSVNLCCSTYTLNFSHLCVRLLSSFGSLVYGRKVLFSYFVSIRASKQTGCLPPPPPPLPLFFLRTAHRFFRSRAPSLSARLAASPPHPHVVCLLAMDWACSSASSPPPPSLFRRYMLPTSLRERVRQLAAPTSFIGGRPVAA